MDLKKLFDAVEGGALTYEQFGAAIKDAKIKLVDLNEGEYLSKSKHADELAAKDKQIEELNNTLSTRDTDLTALQKQLEEAGTDADKLSALSSQFDTMKAQYEADVKNYKDQLKKQAYEFAVKDFANGKKFTSNAAKRDFIQSMIAKELKMEKDTILGADDFVNAYSVDNADAFVVETPDPSPTPTPAADPKPTFVAPTGGGDPTPAQDPTGGFAKAFNFTPIHPMKS